MRLNLSVIADYMKNVTILQQKLDSQSEFLLRYPVHYQGEGIFRDDRLYVAEAERLPTEPVINTGCSIISIGYPPLSYNRNDVEMLCLSGGLGIESVFQEVLEVFDMFYGFESRINDVVLGSDPFDALGEALFDIFETPVQAMTCFDKILFTVYDPGRPEFRERYQQYAFLSMYRWRNVLLLGPTLDFHGFTPGGALFTAQNQCQYMECRWLCITFMTKI